MDVKEKITHLYDLRSTIREYIDVYVKNEDWPKLAEATCDIIDIEARLETLEEQTQTQVEGSVSVEKALTPLSQEELLKLVQVSKPTPSFCTDCDCGKAEGCRS